MKFGYPIRISISRLNEIFLPYKNEFGALFEDKKTFYKLMSNTMGYSSEDFKLGQNMLFFRKKTCPGIHHVLRSELNFIVNKIKTKLKIAAKWRSAAKRFLIKKRMFIMSNI